MLLLFRHFLPKSTFNFFTKSRSVGLDQDLTRYVLKLDQVMNMLQQNGLQKVDTTISSLVIADGGKRWFSTSSESKCLNCDKSYEDAVQTLHTLPSNAVAIENAKKAKEASAERALPKMMKYLQRTDLTAEDLNKLSVIHVSGTKGKGSTCAFSERILSCHGYTTGLYTSPHLFEARERIRINGRPLSKEKFFKYFWSLFLKLKETEIPSQADEGCDMPFYFSFLTLMAIHVFLKEGVDVAIMEVGIGGQYDPTNVFETPVVCGVTALGLDHTDILGNTIEEIAWNKAGIFKKSRPAVVVPQDSHAMQVILNRATERESPLFVSEIPSKCELNTMQERFGVDCEKQMENACLAVHLTDIWMRLHNKAQAQELVSPTSSNIEDISKLRIKDLHETVAEGLSTCVWPGRTQTITRDQITYYLDGAHTKESMEVCTQWFKMRANKEKMHIRGTVLRILIFNTTGDRDVGLFLSLLKGCDFDVALFCTNHFSAVESIKSDLHNHKSSWKRMMEKAASNKAIWDNMTSSSSDWGNSSITSAMSCDSISTDSRSNCVGGSQDLSVDSPNTQDDLTPQAGLLRNKAHSPTNLSQIPSSLVYPCILHTLAWATQGRDPKISVENHKDVDWPEAPAILQEAEHVQILVTGSLHLVGGTLKALQPDMNS